MKKILITGIGGFIGSHLADRLLPHHDIIGVDNFETGRRDNIPKGVIFNEYSITENWIQELFEHFSPDILIHTAASYKDPNNWMKDADTNVRGTAWLCYLAKKYGVRKIIYLQSSLCYGLNPILRVTESGEKCFGTYGPISIECPLNPTPDSYAITKTAAERLIAMSGVPFISLRLSNCYGPRNLNGAIPAIYKKMKVGEQPMVVKTRRTFIYVQDLIDLIERIVNGEGKRNYYHVASGKDNAIMDIYEAISVALAELKCLKSPPAIIKEKASHEVETLLLDPTETFEDFPGWYPKISLQDGIKEAVKWYEENGLEEVYTHLRRE
jgi:UDP-glucose 4-epimerase